VLLSPLLLLEGLRSVSAANHERNCTLFQHRLVGWAETRRHGYRFITAIPPGAIQPETGNSPLIRWGLLLIAAVLLIALVLFVLDVGGLRGKVLFRVAAQPQIRSLAVLPLTNISADPEQEKFADGITEQLITELLRISSLRDCGGWVNSTHY